MLLLPGEDLSVASPSIRETRFANFPDHCFRGSVWLQHISGWRVNLCFLGVDARRDDEYLRVGVSSSFGLLIVWMTRGSCSSAMELFYS